MPEWQRWKGIISMRQVKRVVEDMMVGLCAWAALVLIVLEAVSRSKLAMAAGVIVGTATAAGLLLHMYRHTDIALDMDSGHAQRHAQFAAMRRLIAMAVVLAVSMTQYHYIHPVGTVLGIFGLKIAAFLQPTVRRIRSQRKH